MRQLKEALIGRHNIDLTGGSYTTRINKKEFSTGDVVLMRNGNIGVIVFIKDIKEEDLYNGIHVHEQYGSMVEPDLEEPNCFSGLALNSYANDGRSMWVEDFDIIKIKKKAISVNVCRNPSKLYRELTSNKFDILKESISEALIGKHNIDNSSRGYIEIRKDKSRLKDGDLCMQKDLSIGVYNSNADFRAFNLRDDGGIVNGEPTLIFYMPNQVLTTSEFQHYPIKYYTADLRDKDNEDEFNVVKVIRGLFNPKDVNDPKKVKEFFEKETDIRKYFQ